MEKNYLFLIALFLSYSFGYCQNIGDFRSSNTGTSVWTLPTSWETWDGSSWISTSSYPGENTGTYTVTISSNTAITIPSDLSTTSMGDLIIYGTLVLGNDTSNQHITTLSTKLLTINSTGALTFFGPKVRLILPASDAILIIEPSGTINGSCTNNDEFFVDTNKYATCVGSGSNTYSFGELIATGGTVNAKITNPAINSVVSGCTLINLTGGYDGTENNVTYQWKVRYPNGSTTTINLGSLGDKTVSTSTSFTPSLSGEYLVSLEVTTSSLATNVETRIFNVEDTTNPTITCPANITVNNTPGNCDAAVTYTTPVGADNCSGATTQTTGLASGANFPVGTTTNTFKVTDAAGLETSCSFTVTVVDNQTPTISCPANITVNNTPGTCGAAVTYTTPVGADNCSGATTTQTAGLASGANFPVGTTTNTFKVTDTAGLETSCSFTVTVADNQAPTISCPANITVNNTPGTCDAAVTYTTPVGTDNCSGATTTQTAGLASGANFPVGTTTNTFKVTDAAGLETSCSFTITIVDNQAPTIATLTAISVNADAGVCTYASSQLTAPSASDNCTTVTVTRSPASLVKGLNNVIWTATDAAGLTATSNQSVTVIDNVNPTITAPPTVNATTNTACTATGVALGMPTTADNCSVASVTNDHPSTTYPIGSTTVTWTVTDGSGRTATKTQIVNVIDNINPTITCPTNISQNVSAGTCTASVVTPNPTTADNCLVTKLTWALTGDTVDNSAATGINNLGIRVFNSGVTTVTYRVEDAAGNFTTCSFTVTVVDNIAPEVTLSNVTAQCSVTLTTPTATDNCAGIITGTTNDATAYNSQGTFVVTWAFDDGNGNVTIRTQNVIIDDTAAPLANLASLPTLDISGCQIDSLTPPTATDNCIGTFNGTTTALPITTQGASVITWTYDDGNGNLTTQTQNINLTAPSISGGNLSGFISGLSPAMTPTDNIAITSCIDDVNPITMNLSGQTGDIVRWEKFESGDTAWSVIDNTTSSYDLIFNFNNSKSTLFRVVIQVDNCTRYSNIINVHSIPPDVPPTLSQTNFNTCLNNTVTLVATTGFYSTIDLGDGGGDFNSGQFPDKWDPTQWKIDGQVAGSQWGAAGNNTRYNNWSGTNDHPVGTRYRIEYDSNDAKFGIAHGNFNSSEYIANFGVGPTTLETPIFSLEGLKTAAVQFDQAYNLHAGDYAKVELSLDGGLTYTVVLQNLIGTSPQAKSWAPVPYPYQEPKPNNSTTTHFDFQNDNSSFDISPYIGNSNVRIKWSFFGTTDESTWAVDHITIPLRHVGDALEWTNGIGMPGEYIIRDPLATAYTFTPTAPGVHQYGVTSVINGCRAYDATGTAIATVKVNYAYAGEAVAYTNAECGERTVQLKAYDNTKSADINKANGAYPLALDTFSDDPGTGETGKWSVISNTNTCGTYSFSNISSPSSTFSGDAGVYTLRWTLDTSGCNSDVQVTLTNCNNVNFDGTDDYVSFKNNYGLGTDFSIEVWVKPNPQPANPISTIQTILSKRNANNPIDGYDLRLTGSTLSFNWNDGSKIVSPYPLTTSRWYHVAIIQNSGVYRLYIDGIEVVNAAGSAPIANSFDCIAGAMNQTGSAQNKPVNHFSGWLDEIRIWNTGLSIEHIRQMMNQQIINNGNAVRGEIIPVDIKGPDANKDGIDDQPISWTNLIGYYRMNQINCGYLNPFAGKGVDAKLRNITGTQEETAPLPYLSIRDGNWTDRTTGTTPWKYGDSVWDYPNSTGYNNIPIDWNIVQTAHNINSGNKDITVLGLISTAGKLTIADPVVTAPIENNDGQLLWITHYLKLNGTIDLVGESQLVQKKYVPNQFNESILDVTSLGYLERDQQGKKNSFNYNYWSSPVSNIQGVINNTTYSPASTLKDGTISSTPKNINFGDGPYFADGALSSPILTSNRWIWSYNSKTLESNTEWQDYYQWNYIGNTGLLKTGEGFTMKGTGGSAAIDALQNYVFVGKPNNGNIALPLPYDQTYLVGNPYPSALDANEFILDNLASRAGVNVFNGALYFWDHFGLSNNHNLAEYQGAYATYTLIGGVKAIATSSLTASGTGSKIPQQYIPVGQGFFVDAYLDPALSGSQTTVSGGTLNFKNSQRVFRRESTSNSVFMKTRESAKTTTETKPKIRLGFDSSVETHRQLLVGVDPNTTDSFDLGYDAPMFDTNENDMYWVINGSQFVIQGVPDFNSNRIIPLGLAVATEGEVNIKIDELENVPTSTQIYLHDSETKIYHDLKNSNFKIALAVGNYDNRFSLTFESPTVAKTLDVVENNSNDGIIVLYSNNYKILIIKNNISDSTVNTVTLYDMLGKSIANWNVEDKEQTNIQIPIKNLPSGIYVAKVKTSKGESSKKIIVN
ncbi:MAG TPA: HYR domain-containing protein [Flavobacterium sp.]